MTTSALGEELPVGQPPIQTTGVKRFTNYVNMIMSSRQVTGYSSMGLVWGQAGLGKSVAISFYLQAMSPRAHNPLPAGIQVRVDSGSSSREVAVKSILALAEKPKGRNRQELTRQLIEAIQKNDIQLLIYDEADRLTEDSFDLVRDIYDRSGCPIIVVGLPKLVQTITVDNKFSSRVGLRLEFQQLETQEVLSEVLPNLKIPGWTYDANNNQDCALGQYIWQQTGPSLRNLRILLQYASLIANKLNETTISKASIDEALRWTNREGKTSPPHQTKPNPITLGGIGELTPEELSSLRHEAKHKENSIQAR